MLIDQAIKAHLFCTIESDFCHERIRCTMTVMFTLGRVKQ